MNLHYLSELKRKLFDSNFKFNNLFYLIIFSYIFLWASIGQYVDINKSIFYIFYDINFNSSNILNIGLIHLILFISLSIILIFQILIKKKLNLIILILVYPISSLIGYINNIDLHKNFELMYHFFLTITNLILFFLVLSNLKERDKLINLLLKISFLFILTFFILLVIPDIFYRLKNDIHIRDIYFINLNLFLFDYTYTQNSNGASRMTLIILFLVTLKFFTKLDRKKFSLKYLTLILILSIIFFYFQSKLNLVFFFVYLIFLLLKKKLHFFKKIALFIFIFIIPFSINNFYSSYLNFKNSSIHDHLPPHKKSETQKQFLADKKYYDLFSIALNNRVLRLQSSTKESSKYASYYCTTTHGNLITEKIDQITSGRICGWEILIRDISLKNLLFGKGFFYDQIYLKPFQKITSNSYLNIFYNSGIIGLSVIILIIFIIVQNFREFIKILKKPSFTDMICLNLLIYLLFRGIFEDTLAFNGIDLILFFNCFFLILFKSKKSENNEIINN